VAVADHPATAVTEAPAIARRLRLRLRVRMTLRLRLTLLYGSCFLVAGAALLGITYALVAGHVVGSNAQLAIAVRAPDSPALGGTVRTATPNGVFFQRTSVTGPVVKRTLPAGVPPGFVATAKRLQTEARLGVADVRSSQLNALLIESGIALAIMAVISVGLGWLLAGRALRPLVTMNARARQITEHNLHERLGVEARDDELGELAETFDGVLGRLQRAFDAQRRFVANASHELRTPITLERALVEVALADPDSSIDSLRACCERVLAAGEQQERLIEALLTLARSQAGVQATTEVDLATVAGELIAECQGSAVRIEAGLSPAIVRGDSALLERMLANLLDNAVAYNLSSGGWVRVSTRSDGSGPRLVVVNSGSIVPCERVGELLEPFRRLDGERLNGSSGLGLGLSIVAAIASAHGGTVSVLARPEGGLEVEVSLPAI
jgi:signal transduction histidine kinase